MTALGNRILLVDDDPHILEALQAALLLEGYEVLLACDGKEGLMRAELERPDLIVMDLVMPRWSGLTILEHLRKNPRSHVPIIMMSGLEQEGLRHFVEARGVELFLRKPFCLDAFISKVHEILPCHILAEAGV
ncbi:MAG: response regulator [Planctomycetales bacterium]